MQSLVSEVSFSGLRPVVHLALHLIVPGVVALTWYRERWFRAWLWLLAGWLIDLDHLLADPVYAPERCSIGFHALHTASAILAYGLLTVPKRTRLLGLGLLIHIGLDALDCWMMH
ncbi:MAG: hypothetical protein A3E01_14240 [Gammaproteobacteria bacterium RIFCSPHIGHO2_12_FULL_63_22]|nr:MAG: hypothetical protein A3E01_14240 [Gammaproteobacteria bacterium RIFCSPHIGHO2_12_FULL_63_22]